ncbi:MAG: hypothetical protein QM617_03880, partial [Comamonas sp.]
MPPALENLHPWIATLAIATVAAALAFGAHVVAHSVIKRATRRHTLMHQVVRRAKKPAAWLLPLVALQA